MLTLLCALLLAGAGASAADDAAAAQVKGAEEARFQAMVKGDQAALDRLLAADLTYTHSSGKLETKQELMALIKEGRYQYRSFTPREMKVRVYGETAVVTGLAEVEVTTDGKPLALKLRYTNVHLRKDGRWQLVAWESTRVAEP
jgi:ketosteroid isomerase-like protein